MKRLVLVLALLVSATASLFALRIKLGSEENSLHILQSSPQETILHYVIGQFDTEKTIINGEEWFQPSLPGEGVTQEKGLPELPVFNRSIIIDNSAHMKLEIFDVEYTDMQMPIAPSKGVISREIDPKTVPYSFAEFYAGKDFYPKQIADLSDPYIMRDFRGITIRSTPFAYRPDTRTLRVYHSYMIRVYQEGIDTINVLQQTRSTISRSFNEIYQNHFVNWNNYRYTPLDDSFGKLLVVCHSSFMTTIQPWINWKRQKGIETELVEWSTIGTTATQLQSYIQNRYNQDGNLSYVQIIGDAPQIPSLSSGGGGSDPSFSLVAGSDNYPDIFIGRFSAENEAQLSVQINRSIAYERDLNSSATWLSRAMGIASAEGGGSQGDNGESDIQHMNNIRTKLLNYGYSSVDQVYDPGASAATVTANVNAGRGYINYVGHGSTTAWSTTGFSVTNAMNLSNGNMTPFIVDVACVNGNFVSTTCFAEGWMRSPNGGAITIYASTINQSWNSPMRAQDEIADLWVADAKSTVGGYYYSGSCKMMDIYGNTSSSDGVNMFKTWHIFGDASLMVRSKTPIAMNPTHPAQIPVGSSSLNITNTAPDALVSLTYNNQIYARGYASSSGAITLPLSSLPLQPLDFTLTVTAYNRISYVSAVQQIPASGPFVTVEAIQYADINNQSPDYAETGTLNLTVKNTGSAAATDLNAYLSSTTPGISITDNLEFVGSLAAGAMTTLNGAFSFNIADNIANASTAEFNLQLICESDSWNHTFSLEINAPSLSFGSFTIMDPDGNNNGILDPGESVTITMPIVNQGGAPSLFGTAALSSSTPGITINNPSANFPAIAAGGSENAIFSVAASPSVAQGTLAALNFSAIAGQYSVAENLSTVVGAPTEVTIGSGTGAQRPPLDRYYNYSAHEAIYLATEIGAPGSISSLGYYKSSGTDLNPITAVDIYMKHSTASSLSNGDYSLDGYTLVYSGDFPNNADNGWMEVELDSRFDYDGMSNLCILVVKGYQSWTSTYPAWSYSSQTTARARQIASDDAPLTTLSISQNLPNLKLRIYQSDPEDVFFPPQNLSASSSHQSVALSWQAPNFGTPTGYNIYRDSVLLTNVSGLSYTDTSVSNGTSYSYHICASYSGGESDPSNTVNATPNAFAPTNLIALAGNAYVNLSWNAAEGRATAELSRSNRDSRTISGYRVYRNGTALTTVSETSYSDVSVVNETTYNYRVTTIYSNPAGESAPSNTVMATPTAVIPLEVVLGEGSSSTSANDPSPINIWYKSLHGQSVYTAAELNAAGVFGPAEISHVGFNVTGLPAQPLPNFVVRMKHTSATNVGSWIDNSNLTTVYSDPNYMLTQIGWDMYTLLSPFMWNGSDNILIDTAFDLLANYNPSGTVQVSAVTNGYRYCRSDTQSQSNIFTGGATTDARPNLKLYFNSASEDLPTIAISPASISETVNSGESVSRDLTISNTGTVDLIWSIPEPDAAARSVAGSTIISDVTSYTPGTTDVWNLTVTNTSPDSEWIRDIDVAFPPTVTVNSATSFTGGAYPLTPYPNSGTGVSINWHYSDSSNYGGIYDSQSAVASISVTINNTASGNITLPWTITGDDYGNTPHSVSGTLVFAQAGVAQPDDWFSIATHSGTIAPGEDAQITITMDSTGLDDGSYASSFTIYSNASNDPAWIVPLSLTVDTPILYPVEPRFVAEWEPAQGAVVRYPFGQPYSLLADLSDDALLYVIVSDDAQSAAHGALQTNGVTMENVQYINAPSDSYWTRDYAPWTIFDADGDMHLVDFNYNRPRPLDNEIPGVMADFLGLDIYDLDMNHTGGNVMTDGRGKAMSTELVISENNSLTSNQIHQRFSDFLGVSDYQIYTDPTATYIDHIDCWAKLLDVDKVIIRRVPSTHPQYAAIENSVVQWQAQTSSYGTPYRIFRVDTPNDEPYTNSFIMNGKIYVPQMATVNDAAALAVYQSAMPGFEVSGYTEPSYQSTDALHCRVNTIFDDQMIFVKHNPPTQLYAHEEFTISVEVEHANPLNLTGSFIKWSTSPSGPWNLRPLIAEDYDTWTSSLTIPAIANLYYYIQAQDNTGRSTKLPLCAELDPFVVPILPNPDLPDWTVTQYPNPPATVYATVSVMGNPAAIGDLVGAFVGEECRGTGFVFSNRNNMVSIPIQLAESGENVTFKVYSHTDDLIYDADLELSPGTGEILGADVPLQISCGLVQPVVNISLQDGEIHLNWDHVQNASYYQLGVSDNPNGGFTPLFQTVDNHCSLPVYFFIDRQFYIVIAVKDN